MIMKLSAAALCLFMLSSCQMYTMPDESDPLNELPMFGGQREPYTKKRSDESRKAFEEGWDCLYTKKELRNAMMHFNRAWMYDPENAKAYWGMGLVLGIEAEDIENPENRLEKIDRSIRLIERAQDLDSENPSIKTSLAKEYMDKACRTDDMLERGKFLKKAEEKFAATSRVAPKGSTYFNWSVCLYHQERYEEAWKMLMKANELNYKTPADYLANLKFKAGK